MSNSSSQPQARSLKQKQKLNTNNDDLDSDNSSVVAKNENELAPSKKRKHKYKNRTKKTPNTWLDFFTKALLLFVTIYTFTVCPDPDSARTAPICRGLDAYRRIVLEPLLLPPLRFAVNHPSVQPYIAAVTPAYTRTTAILTPAVKKAHTTWTGTIVPQWRKRVVPRYKAHVLPLWYKHVLPLWRKHALPLWHKHVVTHWKVHAAPHIAKAQVITSPYIVAGKKFYTKEVEPRAWAFYGASKPYINRAAVATHSAYVQAVPYARPAWNRAVAETLRALAFLQAQRRTYVDPQVAKIWDKVLELSTRRTPASNVLTAHVMPTTASGAFTAHVMPTPTSAEQEGRISAEEKKAGKKWMMDAIGKDHSPDTPVPEATPEVETATMEVTGSQTAEASPTETPLSSAERTTETTQATAEEPTPASVHSTPETTPSPSEQQAENIKAFLSDLVDDISTAAESGSAKEPLRSAESIARASARASSVPHGAAAQKTEEPDEEEFDIDFEEFTIDLGIMDSDEDAVDSSSETEPATPPVPILTPEEIAGRKAENEKVTAEKRADITARHAAWEVKMSDEMISQRKILRKTLVALRKASTQRFTEDKELRGQVEAFITEAEKLLRGAEVYLKTMKRDSPSGDQNAARKWGKVVDKVSERFAERMYAVEEAINAWYEIVVKEELSAVEEAVKPIQALADSAQTDIALDYAWLDDVTYQDWQRYHDLVRNVDSFRHQLLSIQNGTHASPPMDPVRAALRELQAELEDVTTGFETRLRGVRRAGVRAFGRSDKPNQFEDDEDETEAEEDDGKVGVKPVPPKVEILEPEAPPVVIGRGSGEVHEAAARAAGVAHEEL